MKRIIAILCAVLSILMLASCAPKPAADVPEDSIFYEIVLNKNKTRVTGLKSGMRLEKVLEVLGLEESDVQIDTAVMDTVDPPIEYSQVETIDTYTYSENENIELKKTFYFENGKLVFMMYYASSNGKDFDQFYNDSITFINNFIERSGAEYTQDSGEFGYTTKGYPDHDAFILPGARYRFLFQNSGVLDEIGISSSSVSTIDNTVAMNLEIDISFL